MSRYVETEEYGHFARRVLAAYGRRVAGDADAGLIGDIAMLGPLADMATVIDQALQATVDGLRAGGHSWADIGRELGVSRQAAQQKYGRAAA